MIDSIIDSISRFTPTPLTKKVKLLKKYIKLHVIFWFIHHTSSIFWSFFSFLFHHLLSFFFFFFNFEIFSILLLVVEWNFFVTFLILNGNFSLLNSLNNNIFVLLYAMLSLMQCYSVLFCGCMMVGRMRGNICVWWCVDTFFIYKIPNNI